MYLTLASRLLSPVSSPMSHIYCIISPVSRLLSHVSCLMYPVSCILSHVYCLTSSVLRQLSNIPSLISSLLSPVSCLLTPVSCLLPLVSCHMSPVSRLMSPFSRFFCLMPPVSRIMSHVSCLTCPALCPTMLNCFKQKQATVPPFLVRPSGAVALKMKQVPSTGKHNLNLANPLYFFSIFDKSSHSKITSTQGSSKSILQKLESFIFLKV